VAGYDQTVLGSFVNLAGPDFIVLLLIGAVLAFPVVIGVAIAFILARRKAKPPPLPNRSTR